MNNIIEKNLLAIRQLDDGIASLVAASVAETSHLDEESVAALIEGSGGAFELMHVLQCAGCHHLVEECALDAHVVPFTAPGTFGAPTRTTGAAGAEPHRAPLRILPSRRVIAASLRIHPDRSMQWLSGTGMWRTQAAIATRSNATGTAGLHLRDSHASPQFEVAVMPTGSARMNILVRWLHGTTHDLTVRVSAAGRLLAEQTFVAGSTMINNLRRSDVAVDVFAPNGCVASAWLEVEP